jgi:hypothetical protein
MDSFDFDRLNHTELYQVCRGAGLNPLPSWTRRELILLLEREVDAPEAQNLFDRMREGIFEFVDEHWEVLQSQVTCPAKARDIKACFGCADSQVLSCVIAVKPMDRFIQLRRK